MAGYTFLPELEGLTRMSQEGLADKYRAARSGLRRSFMRSPMQSSGAYFGALSNMASEEARGMSDIERENLYKNAMLGREERLTREGRDWQEAMADEEMRRQLKMMETQRGWQKEDALWNALGSLAGQIGSTAFGWAGKKLGLSMSPWEAKLNQAFSGLKPEDMLRIYGIGGGNNEF